MLKRTKGGLHHCPMCSLELLEDKSGSSEKLANAINELQVHCPRNCGGTPKYGHLEIHLSEQCPLGRVICVNTGCHRKLKRKELQDHLNVCDFRIISCRGCSKTMKLADLRQHQKVQNCINQLQKQMIVRNLREGEKELKKHIENLKEDSFKVQRETRDLEKGYVWKRIERNPGSFSPTLVQRHSTESHLGLVPCSRPTSGDSEDSRKALSSPALATKGSVGKKKRTKSADVPFCVCFQCNCRYDERTNSEDACSWHAGVRDSYFVFSPPLVSNLSQFVSGKLSEMINDNLGAAEFQHFPLTKKKDSQGVKSPIHGSEF